MSEAASVGSVNSSSPAPSHSGSPLRVIIVGGGISGLSAAYFIEKFATAEGVDCSIELFEAADRLGGVILTERREGFLVEGGPDSFLTQKPAAIELCRELGLGEHLLPSQDEKRKTYLLHHGKLQPLPDGLFFVIPSRVWPVISSNLLSVPGKLRLALSPFLPPLTRDRQDVSVAQFISRRFGKEVLERLAEPLLAAVYGADVDTLSARAALPQLIALEEKYGTLWRALPHARPPAGKARQPIFTTLRDGLGELPAALQARLRRTALRRGVRIRALRRRPDDHLYEVEFENPTAAQAAGLQGRSGLAEMLVLAIPAPAAARLLRDMDEPLSKELAGIQYNSSVMAALAFPPGAFAGQEQGFGFVVPRTEQTDVVACTWSSTKFPLRSPEDCALVRCFFGGARHPEVLQQTNEQIVSSAVAVVDKLFHAQRPPLFTRVYRWEGRMPQYAVGHLSRIQAIQSRLSHHSGLFLAGNGYSGVGIPDCIQVAQQVAHAVMQFHSQPQR